MTKMEYVAYEIKKLLLDGVPPRKIHVVQGKRYIDTDAISVNGYWFAVRTTLYAGEVEVVSTLPKYGEQVSTEWLDENGRAICDI